MVKHHRIVIIGAGKIGSAITSLLQKENLHDCWDAIPGKVPHQKSLEEIVPKADLLFLCVPTWCIHEAIREVLPHLRSKTAMISVSKGIEQKTGKTMDELFKDSLPHGQRFALLLGPMLADELLEGFGGAAVVAVEDTSIFKLVRTVFQPKFLLEYSSDLHGAAFLGVLKNIYSIGLGIIEAVGWGKNMRGWMMAQAIREMRDTITILGGNRETLFTPAGIADFLATGLSLHSKNRTVGEEIVRQGKTSTKSEGLVSFPFLWRRLQDFHADLPVLSNLKRVLMDGESARTIFPRQ